MVLIFGRMTFVYVNGNGAFIWLTGLVTLINTGMHHLACGRCGGHGSLVDSQSEREFPKPSLKDTRFQHDGTLVLMPPSCFYVWRLHKVGLSVGFHVPVPLHVSYLCEQLVDFEFLWDLSSPRIQVSCLLQVCGVQ